VTSWVEAADAGHIVCHAIDSLETGLADVVAMFRGLLHVLIVF